MINSKKLNIIVATAMIIAILFTGVLIFRPSSQVNANGTTTSSSQPKYVSKLFDKNSIMTIDIKVKQEAWDEMLKNAMKEEYIPCDVTVNGVTYKSVGIRPKGNSSLAMVASDTTTDRFSFKIEFDNYIEGQTCEGLNKLAINNIQADATYMKEYISYEILDHMGIATPLHSYTNISLNGKPWGLYLAVETVDSSFAQRVYGIDYGKLYKPEGMGIRGNGQQGNAIGMGNMPGGAMMGGGGGTDLKYTDDNISSYSNIFNNAVFDSTSDDYKRIIKAIKNLNSGTKLEKYLDVDSALRYIAANTFVVNLDSYFSSMKHNYYLYEKNGKLTVIPWDYNLAFGGFQSGSSSAAINFPIDTPLSGTTMEASPLVGKLLAVPEYKEKYHKYLNEITENYINNGTFTEVIDKTDKLIKDYVKNDPTAFYTYEEYTASLPTLKLYGELRAKSIDGQLKGMIPSTTEGQKADSSKLIDASAVNLSVLGTMGMGGGEGNKGNGNQNGFPQGGQGGQGGMPDMSKMPDMSLIPQVMQIIGNSDVKSLSEEQVTKIKALGITDEQLDMLKNIPFAPGGMAGGMPGGNGRMGMPGGGAVTAQNGMAKIQNIVMIGISAILLICGLVFVKLFRRRRKR